MTNRRLLKEGFRSGTQKGRRGFLWIIKILLPLSFLTALLDWSGLIHLLDPFFRPVMGWLHLPPLAALPLLIGMTAGIYAGTAAMAVLPFNQAQMTLMAVFMLTAHNLIQEGVIQGKSGFHPLKATLTRVGTAILLVWAAAPFLDSLSAEPAGSVSATASLPLIPAMLAWALSTLSLLLKILAIIMTVMIFVEILKALGWVDRTVQAISPLLKPMGLSSRSGIAWVAGLIFGLVYGAAVIAEEAREGKLSRQELEELHISIGVQHSIIEDPLLFVAIGCSPFWLWVPRLLAAIAVVHAFRLWQKVGTGKNGIRKPETENGKSEIEKRKPRV